VQVEPGVRYTYWLEALEMGENQEFGPVTIAAPYPLFLPLLIH
jgi:hypothetical protein